MTAISIFELVGHFAAKYWRIIAALVLIAFVWILVADFGHQKYKEGAASKEAEDAAALAKQIKDNATELARIQALNTQVSKDNAQLKADLDDARAARSPAVIRVRTVQGANNCSAVPAIPNTAAGSAEGNRQGLSGELQQTNTRSGEIDFDFAPIDRINDEADDEHIGCQSIKEWLRGVQHAKSMR